MVRCPNSSVLLPKFTEKLKDAEANESKQLIMKCKLTYQPRPTIQWFKNGQEITKDPRVYVDPTGNDCSRRMAGEYEIKQPMKWEQLHANVMPRSIPNHQRMIWMIHKKHLRMMAIPGPQSHLLCNQLHHHLLEDGDPQAVYWKAARTVAFCACWHRKQAHQSPGQRL